MPSCSLGGLPNLIPTYLSYMSLSLRPSSELCLYWLVYLSLKCHWLISTLCICCVLWLNVLPPYLFMTCP